MDPREIFGCDLTDEEVEAWELLVFKRAQTCSADTEFMGETINIET